MCTIVHLTIDAGAVIEESIVLIPHALAFCVRTVAGQAALWSLILTTELASLDWRSMSAMRFNGRFRALAMSPGLQDTRTSLAALDDIARSWVAVGDDIPNVLEDLAICCRGDRSNDTASLPQQSEVETPGNSC
jgi:hypothetical protein